jgi:hypothetical protein
MRVSPALLHHRRLIQRYADTGGGGGLSAVFKFVAATDDVTALGGYTFSRADAATCATYTDSSGVLHLVAANVVRNAHFVAGNKTLLLEPASTNLITRCLDLSSLDWASSGGNGSAAPTVGANATTDPFGTASAAASLAIPAATGTAFSDRNQSPAGQTATTKVLTAYIKGASGGEQNYIGGDVSGTTYDATRFTATTSWQRFQCVMSNTATSTGVEVEIGVDLRNASATATSAVGIFASGVQLENRATPTSLIVSGASQATRAADVLSVTVPGGAGQAGTLYEKYYDLGGTIHETVNQAFTTGATFAPATDRAWVAWKFALGVQTLAAMQAL